MQSERASAMQIPRTCPWLSKRTPTLGAVVAMLLFATLTAPVLFAQSSESDPAFKGIPFDLWIAGNDTTQIPWGISVQTPELTDFQRLAASISADIPVSGLRASQGGQFLYVAQITDSRGKSYRTAGAVNITNPLAQKTSVTVSLFFNAFLLPGDYQLALSIYDPVTERHNMAHRYFDVPRLKNEPLPDAWTNLPSVAFFSDTVLPDSQAGNLDLPLKEARPVHIEVIANATPTHALAPSMEVFQTNLSHLIPELEVLSQIRVNTGSVDVIALDLENHKIAFEQDSIQTLEWQRLQDALNPKQATVVSLSSLSERSLEAKFFTGELSRRVSCGESLPGESAPDLRRVIIVISDEMAFARDVDLSPVSTEGICNSQVFYIRTHFLLYSYGQRSNMTSPNSDSPIPEHGGSRLNHPGVALGPNGRLPHSSLHYKSIPYEDQLEKTLAPLKPRVFEVKSPGDFRKAIASILAEAGKP
jgi:hypothetical protein